MAKKPNRSAAKKVTPQQAKKAAARKPGELSRFQKAVIVAFILIFALSTLASALASVYHGTTSGGNSSSSNEQAADPVAALDEKYQPTVSELEAKVAADASDTASLLALGNYYCSWGLRVKNASTTDDATSHANELFEKAVSAYDSYLAVEDSEAVRTDRAMCKYYEEDTTAAISALEEIVDANPDYAYAWVRLGAVYEAQGSTDDAKNCYQWAVSKDPDDAYGAKSYAEERLSAIAASEASSTDASSGTQNGSDLATNATDLTAGD